MRTLRLLRAFWTNSIQVELEFRADLVVNLINAPLMFGAGLVVLAAVFADGQTRSKATASYHGAEGMIHSGGWQAI